MIRRIRNYTSVPEQLSPHTPLMVIILTNLENNIELFMYTLTDYDKHVAQLTYFFPHNIQIYCVNLSQWSVMRLPSSCDLCVSYNVFQKKPQLLSNTITCNDVPLVRETVSSPSTSSTVPAMVQDIDTIDDDDDSYVYDVYRTEDKQFDFQSLEHVLAIQALMCVSHCFFSMLHNIVLYSVIVWCC